MPKFCPTCGKPLQFENAEICPSCGVRVQNPPTSIETQHAGFWIRFGAYLIDLIIVYVITLGIVLMSAVYMPSDSTYGSYKDPSSTNFITLVLIIFIFVLWTYFAIQESSTAKATIGKRAVKITVNDSGGNQISFWTATLRTFIKFIPIIGTISCLFVAVSVDKRGLHDMAASTYVNYK